MNDTTQKRLARFADLPAMFVGVQVLVKGWDKIEHFDHHPVLVSFLLLMGAIIIIAAAVMIGLNQRMTHTAHAHLHVAEGAALVVSAILLFEKGGLRIPVLLLFIGCAYVLAGYLEYQKPGPRKEHLAIAALRWLGVAFVAMGLLLALYTVNRDRDAWALGAAGVCALIGAALLLLPMTKAGRALLLKGSSAHE